MLDKTHDFTNYIDKAARNIAADQEKDTIMIIKEMLLDSSNFQSFSDGLSELIAEHGYSGSINDNVAMADFLYSKVDSVGIDMERFASKETVRNWFSGKSTPFGEKARFNMIAVAFSLDLNLEDTTDFFGKVFMGQPFNFRIPEECIYYYCINNYRPYSDAERLIEAYHEQYHEIQCEEKNSTRVIMEQISRINDDDSLLEFLLKGANGSREYYNTARTQVKRLTASDIKCANELNKKWHIFTKGQDYDNKEERIKSVNSLVKFIYGFSTDLCHNKESKRKFNKDLTDVIKRNFPKQHEIGKILNDSPGVNEEMVRKALILLYFVHSYGKAYLYKESPEHFTADRFITSCSVLLLDCGFQEMYIRNAFDFIFFYCAYCVEYSDEKGEERFRVAFDTFHSIINEIYELKEEGAKDE